MSLHLADKLRRYQLALCINVAVWILQSLFYVIWADSKSLLGDALHSLSDTIVLLGIVYLTRRELAHPDQDHHKRDRWFTRGAIFLFWISAAFVSWEGIERIRHPEAFSAGLVIGITLVAAIGNFLAHKIMSGVKKSVHDHKHRASILHVIADLIISLVVLVSALLTMLFSTPAIDGWGALGVALWMIVRGITLWKENGAQQHHHHHHH